ncbi:MAG: hypothetical protein JWN54_1641 [Mycobacterium sp.]|nr:hypothetical protein [Mycobacterium sp.]
MEARERAPIAADPGDRGAPRRTAGEAVRPAEAALLGLQRTVGNRAATVVAQRNGGGKRKQPTETVFDAALQDFTSAMGTGSRPARVTGAVVPTEPARPPTAVAQAYRQKDQGGRESVRPLLGFDGGHVVGLQLGGPNVGDNVVPMYPAFNRGVWKNMEDATKQDAARRRSRYRMTVTLAYGGPEPTVPTALTVVREAGDPVTGAWTQALAPVTLSQPGDIPLTARLSPADERVVNPQTGDKLDAVTRDDPADLFETGGLLLKDYLNAKHAMPPSRKAMYPDDPAQRPYGLLDLLTFNGRITFGETLGAGSDFSATQRTLILQTNMARNGGRLKSDDPADPQQYLDERGAANSPEIDHIVPKSLGGSNFYSNARVVSWQLNNKVARVKPLRGLVDLARLALPTLPRTVLERARVIVEQYLARLTAADFAATDVLGWADQVFSPQTATVKRHVDAELANLATQGRLVSSGRRYRPA